MSRPGDKGRRQFIATSPEDVFVKAVEAVSTIPGAQSFELSYDGVDRVLADDEEPGPEDRIRWKATAVVRRKFGRGRPVEHAYVGEQVCEPGGDHGMAGALAIVALLERLGANTVVIDMNDTTDPREDRS